MFKKSSFAQTSNWLLLMAFLLIIPAGVKAQTTGTIYGTVMDAQGAAVSGAAVTVTNLETNLSRSTTSGEGGIWTFTLLPVGSYSVSIEASGFKTFVRERVDVDVQANVRVDVRLEIGQVTEKSSKSGALWNCR